MAPIPRRGAKPRAGVARVSTGLNPQPFWMSKASAVARIRARSRSGTRDRAGGRTRDPPRQQLASMVDTSCHGLISTARFLERFRPEILHAAHIFPLPPPSAETDPSGNMRGKIKTPGREGPGENRDLHRGVDEADQRERSSHSLRHVARDFTQHLYSISIRRRLAFSVLGTLIVSTPLSYLASMFVASTEDGSANVRWKVP